MRICYIAKHNSGGNDDEGAIAHALTQMGHHVDRLDERHGKWALRLKPDLVLFHKWHHVDAMKSLEGKVPRVFWWFDVVEVPGDPTLSGRNQSRAEWMRDVMPHVEIGFLSDGDWAARDPKLVHLTQGADSRYAGLSRARVISTRPSILFTGVKKGGRERESFVDEMSRAYGSTFHHVQRGVHGKELATLIASSTIVVAPDGPVTNRYWSNRVYLTLGYGGFLLHPYCESLYGHYLDGREIVYYQSREDLHHKIAFYLDRPDLRKEIAMAGLARTMAEHTYDHRCAMLMDQVRRRLGWNLS